MIKNFTKFKVAVVASLFMLTSGAVNAVALGSYNVNPNTVSVSGLSAGGFMAVQLAVAYSNKYPAGLGVFAGGPFDCARNQSYTACMYNATPSITTPSANMTTWSNSGQIDPLSNLANLKFYGFVGSSDYTVGPNPMNQLKSQLQSKGVTTGNTVWYQQSGTAHTFPTDYAGSGDNACGTTASPYVSNCSYDGAKNALQHFYGTLNARTTPGTTLSDIQFSQTEFNGGAGFDSNGYVFVPSACASGSACKLHVVLHGCVQSYSKVGKTFIDNSLYKNWANTNNIIVLFPQAIADNTSHSTPGSGSIANPNGCFDWVGWYGTNFDYHGGQQMAAINAMVDRITAGYSGGTTTTTTTTTTTSEGQTTTTSTTTTTLYPQTSANFSSQSNTNYVKATCGTGTYPAVGTLGNVANGRGSDGKCNRGIYSFVTSGIPADATITKANLTLVFASIVSDPWASPAGNTLVVDVKNGYFGAAETVGTDDWASAPTASAVATIAKVTSGSVTSADFNASGKSAIAKGTGAITQLKTRFSSDQTASSKYVFWTTNATLYVEWDGGTPPETTTTTTATTTTTVATTTTTTAGACYSETSTATVLAHYTAGRINVTQYNQLGVEYGYLATVTLYHAATFWTDHIDCTPIS